MKSTSHDELYFLSYTHPYPFNKLLTMYRSKLHNNNQAVSTTWPMLLGNHSANAAYFWEVIDPFPWKLLSFLCVEALLYTILYYAALSACVYINSGCLKVSCVVHSRKVCMYVFSVHVFLSKPLVCVVYRSKHTYTHIRFRYQNRTKRKMFHLPVM